MATWYDVLGVPTVATSDQIRRAYYDLARTLHPDRIGGLAGPEIERASRRMQDVNEAWRVLRDPASRATYDRSLRPQAPDRPPRREEPDLDEPYPQQMAEPGDLGVSMARGLPWLVLAVILAAIFVFTAFAGGAKGSHERELVGECVKTGRGADVTRVPCGGPNDGKVRLVVERASLCPSGSTTRAVSDGLWICLTDPDEP